MGGEEDFLPAEQHTFGHDVHIVASDRDPACEGYKQHISGFLNERIIGSAIYEDNNVINRLLQPFVPIKYYADCLKCIAPESARGYMISQIAAITCFTRNIREKTK
jgi:hypothetical protein